MRKVLHWLDKNLEYMILYPFGATLCASVTLQVLTRFINVPFSWTEEVCRFSFVWVVYAGISFATKRGSHIRFNLIGNFISGKVEQFYYAVMDFIMAVLWIVIFYYSIQFVKFGHATPAPALNISISVRNGSCIVGVFMTIFRNIQNGVLRLRSMMGKAEAIPIEIDVELEGIQMKERKVQ